MGGGVRGVFRTPCYARALRACVWGSFLGGLVRACTPTKCALVFILWSRTMCDMV